MVRQCPESIHCFQLAYDQRGKQFRCRWRSDIAGEDGETLTCTHSRDSECLVKMRFLANTARVQEDPKWGCSLMLPVHWYCPLYYPNAAQVYHQQYVLQHCDVSLMLEFLSLFVTCVPYKQAYHLTIDCNTTSSFGRVWVPWEIPGVQHLTRAYT